MIDNLKNSVNPRFTNLCLNACTYNDIDYSITFPNKISQNFIKKGKAKYRLERKSISNKIILNNSPMVEINKVNCLPQIINNHFSLGEIIDNYNSYEITKPSVGIKRLQISLRNDNKDKFINKKRDQVQALSSLEIREEKKLSKFKCKIDDFKFLKEISICSKCNYLFESNVEVDDIIKHMLNC